MVARHLLKGEVARVPMLFFGKACPPLPMAGGQGDGNMSCQMKGCNLTSSNIANETTWGCGLVRNIANSSEVPKPCTHVMCDAINPDEGNFCHVYTVTIIMCTNGLSFQVLGEN